MTQIATTIEQGKRLIEAGVSPETADMCWYKAVNGMTFLTVRGETPFWDADAWSLSALWEIFHKMDKTYEFSTDLDSGQLIETLVRIITFRRK